MGNHEYCVNCGESDFHYGRKCNPKLVAQRIAKEKQEFEDHEARVDFVVEKLKHAGIPFTIRRHESLAQESIYQYYRKIDINIWEVELK